ncbi:glycoside hydrolase family 104 protein [Tumidithrix elongata RA019]|uniref:Glycoside hydrolase family 104 protein n=1 Tax=Tumidithrix elongata BACA0141 TaxID=2716417 RepID=A0AAW9PZ06_9CYAN|nr:glycoside hydrolase family 104 protein [Tumidithrix elongata RA019]
MIQLLEAIPNYKHLPHQQKAIAYLQDHTPTEVLEEFAEIWKTEASETPEIHPQIQAFLNTIRVPEGTNCPLGYQTMFTGKVFSDFSDHPRQIQCAGELCSDAAGAYQFLSTTWDDVAQAIGATDFSPHWQDLAAVELLRRRDAYEDILAGRLQSALDKCSWEWASLPPGRYGQPSLSYEDCDRLFQEFGGKSV